MNPGSLNVLLGNGDGTFRSGASRDVGRNPVSIVLGDVDRDGIIDAVVANAGAFAQNLSVLLGNGDGTFAPPHTIKAGAAPQFVTVADLNGDGKLDVITGNYDPDISNSAGIAVALGNGDGTFQRAVRYDTAAAILFIVAADFDGDGKLDLAGGE